MNNDAIPNDADGDAIRRVLRNGSNPLRPMKIEFHVSVPTETAGHLLIPIVVAKSYAPILSCDEGHWTCSCSRSMLLDYDLIVECQRELDELSAPLGGFSDGWGTFGNVGDR